MATLHVSSYVLANLFFTNQKEGEQISEDFFPSELLHEDLPLGIKRPNLLVYHFQH